MGPFFAWVAPTETTFGPEHHREDEDVFRAQIQHNEGQIATMAVEIRNPRIGLLAPGREYWAWYAWDDGTTITPLFFGRLVGVPDNVLNEVIVLNFIARPRDFIVRKQIVAETLKVAPYYDPVWLDLQKRDDPDAILEAYSAVWHIDRVTHAVTISDILLGEDSDEEFFPDDAFYDSVKVSLGQPPLTAVSVTGTVTWQQQATGYINFGNRTFSSYSGDGIVSDWPKTQTQLGSGWSVAFSIAVDVYGVGNALTSSMSYQWRNSEKRHINGDSMSLSISESKPLLPPDLYISGVLSSSSQNGFLDPFATDSDGDPAPLNIPMQVQQTLTYVPRWVVNTSMIMRYDADRQRQERVHFNLRSDLQAVITDPLFTQNTEKIDVTGADLSEPILNQLNWSAVAGQAVGIGQLIFPDNPTLPDQQTIQIATVAGTAGLVQPEFSEVAGTITTDGTVTWSSLGTATPSGSAPAWSRRTIVPLGQLLLPRRPVYIEWSWLVQAGRLTVPQTGVSVSYGQIVRTSNGSWQYCILSGTTGLSEPAFSTTWGTVTADGNAEWVSLGLSIPLGFVYFVCTQTGTTGDYPPEFSNDYGTTTTDGTAVWTSIGAAELPIGGWPGNTLSDCYFPTDRGQRSLKYLICKARAHVRYRSRAVSVSWDCPFERALALSCRKNAILHDRRLPGGIAAGKITGYSITMDGDKSLLTGSVTIGCAVGYGDVTDEIDGTPEYVDAEYMDPGIQYYTDATLADWIEGEVGFTPPARGVYDDGLVFPLTKDQVVEVEEVHGTLAAQVEGITLAIKSAQLAAAGGAASQGAQGSTIGANIQSQILAIAASQNSVGYNLQINPIWYELQLKPLTNGPFVAEYFVTTTKLNVPKLIDLEAPSQ